MEKADFDKEIDFELEIGYSKDAVSDNFIFGILAVLFSIGLTVLLHNWIVAVFLSPLGVLLIWKAIKQIRSKGPQLKLGHAGVWTVGTGFLPWNEIQANIKTQANYRTAPIYLIMLSRSRPTVEIGCLPIAELDVNVRTLQAYLNLYSPKQMRN